MSQSWRFPPLLVAPLIGALICVGCGDDSTKPSDSVTVSLTTPAEGAILVGSIEIIASASGATQVRFLVDDTEIGTDETAPYLVSWNTTSVANGSHVVKVVAEGGGEQAEDQASVSVNNPGGGIAVTVSPATATVSLGATQQFTATVLGTTDTGVNWSVEGGAAFGSISASGLYSAPATPPSPPAAIIRATSVADPSKSGTAQVTLSGGLGIVVTVSPSSVQLELGQTQQFTAIVVGTTNTGVTWSVDGGATFGTISESGFYSAPATLPSPASASVRATSQAEPTRSGTAQVTLVSVGLPAEDRKLLLECYSAGFTTTQSATELVESLAQLVFIASEQNGNQLTLTGTLTQTAPGSESFAYASEPGDRLVIKIFVGDVLNTLEAMIQSFAGDLSSWSDFRDYHSDLRFRFVWPGQLDLQISSVSGAPGAATMARDGARSSATLRVFQRTIAGSSVYEGETVNINLSHQGQVEFEVDGDFADYHYQEQVTGTASSPSGQIQVGEAYESRIVVGSQVVENYHRRNNSSGVRGATTFQFQDVYVRREFTENVVAQEDYWLAEGTVLKNGLPFGTVRFDGPVIKGTRGPRTILDLGQGVVLPF